MRIPARFAPVLFSAILSAIMVCIMSAFILFVSVGWVDNFFHLWSKSCLIAWPVAFPTVLAVAPMVRRFVQHITAA